MKVHRKSSPSIQAIKITPEIQAALAEFIELFPPHIAKRNLRKMFMDYLKRPDLDDTHFSEILQQVDAMFDLLDVIDDNLNPKKEF